MLWKRQAGRQSGKGQRPRALAMATVVVEVVEALVVVVKAAVVDERPRGRGTHRDHLL